jgi:hypothetical protein
VGTWAVRCMKALWAGLDLEFWMLSFGKARHRNEPIHLVGVLKDTKNN